VKVEKTIDIFGQFVEKNDKEGLKATQTSVYVIQERTLMSAP
jgi:hypothetical protein